MVPTLKELTELDRSRMCVTEAACGVEGVLAKGAVSSGGEQQLRAGQAECPPWKGMLRGDLAGAGSCATLPCGYYGAWTQAGTWVGPVGRFALIPLVT